jgi:hypothetical protein
MNRPTLALTICLVICLSLVYAQKETGDNSDKGTYLGVLIGPVPEVLYDQLTDLPRGQGVVVTHILPDSPAARAGLKRHDILLQYDNEKIIDCEHFARLIKSNKPDDKIRLTLLRGGKSTSVDAVLELGTLLRVAQSNKPTANPADNVPRGTAKAGSPPTVSVSCTPLDAGRLKITVEYYPEETNRLKTVAFEGTINEIESQVRILPARVTSYTDRALLRLKELELAPKDQR